MTTRAHLMPFGATLLGDAGTRFRAWAPTHERLNLELNGDVALEMERAPDGWFEALVPSTTAGTRYRFVLPDGFAVPDPAARSQPDGVHGASMVVDPNAYRWQTAWRGRPWHEAVLYELHIGTFTPAGTFAAAHDKLDHLVELGVTALQIMPVAACAGDRNWGYDGVFPFAPTAAYGTPEDFKALIDAAHARGLMVLLDVVYNHFGPEGNYLPLLAPPFFTDRHQTPWGDAINFDEPDRPAVRQFFIHNALYWLEEFGVDGLRLDAVHAIQDDSELHVLDELASTVQAHFPDRQIHLVLENEENESTRLVRDTGGRPRTYTAQWNDDAHHVMHVAATGESEGYYADYLGDTEKLARAFAEGFAFQGETMAYRGHARGEPSGELPTTAFVAFLQNHDQIGNRAMGERISALATGEVVRACAATYLLAPQIPMLFMGEEWAAAEPFLFFCDFGPDLADAVREGRRAEFARFPAFADPASRARIPDPVAIETFASSKLGWHLASTGDHATTLDWYQRILAVRHAEIMPRLSSAPRGGRYEVIGAGAFVVSWDCQDGKSLTLTANLSPHDQVAMPRAEGRVIWSEGAWGDAGAAGPWSVRWHLDQA